MSEFVTVAREDDVPSGRGLSVCVDGREFALYRIEGRFYALDGRCPHRGGPLGEGLVERGHVYCPLHGWEFDVRTGACIDHPEKCVARYPVRVEDGRVQVCFERS